MGKHFLCTLNKLSPISVIKVVRLWCGVVIATNFNIPKIRFNFLFGNMFTVLYSKLSANIIWEAVIEYLARKSLFLCIVSNTDRQEQFICNEFISL